MIRTNDNINLPGVISRVRSQKIGDEPEKFKLVLDQHHVMINGCSVKTLEVIRD